MEEKERKGGKRSLKRWLVDWGFQRLMGGIGGRQSFAVLGKPAIVWNITKCAKTEHGGQ